MMRDVKYWSALLGVSMIGFCSFISCAPTSDDIPFSLTGNSEELSEFISAISSDEPSGSTWAAYQAEKNTMTGDETYTVNISFGTHLDKINYFEVTVESEDFEITKSCPDRYEIGFHDYSDEEFYVPYGTELNYDNLPQKFTLTFDKKGSKDTYSGCVEIKIIGYMRGGHDGAILRLYYYGDNDLICFSSQKQAATNIYMMKKG